jgi:hypothetical protein
VKEFAEELPERALIASAEAIQCAEIAVGRFVEVTAPRQQSERRRKALRSE